MERVKLLLHQHKHTYSDFEYYHLHIKKIEKNTSLNPDIAIETCKSLIEGVSKSILNKIDNTFDEDKETTGRNAKSVQKLFTKALIKLSENNNEFELPFVQNVGKVINVISELRTNRGDISHGKSAPKQEESSPEFAKMIVDMTDLIMGYTLKHFFQINIKTSEKLDYFPKDEGNLTKDEEIIIQYNRFLDESQPDFPISTTSYSQLLYEHDYDEYENRYFNEFKSSIGIDNDLKESIVDFMEILKKVIQLKDKAVDAKVEKVDPKVIVEVNTPTIKSLSESFQKDLFWSKEKLEKTNDFAIENELIFDEKFKKIIEDIKVFDDQEKIVRSDIVKIMKYKPKLNQYDTVVQLLLDKIINFSQNLDKE